MDVKIETMHAKEISSCYPTMADEHDVSLGYKWTEVGAIPRDWEITSLGRICSMKSGIGITSASIDEFSRYPCFGGNGIRGFTERFTHSGRFSLIGRQGALCGNVVLVEGKFFASEHAIIVTASAKTDTDWLFFVLDRMHLNEFSESSAQPGLSVSKILLLPVACPPLLEQNAIAEALSDSDALIESLEQLLTKKRQIKKGAMQELLTGKRRLPGFSGEWATSRIGDISDVDPENLPSTTNLGFKFNYISLEQVDAGRLLSYSEVEFGSAPSRARRVLRHGDVLMSTVRPNLMAHLLYVGQVANAVCSTGFAVLRSKPNLSDPGFLLAHLFSHVVNKQIERTLAGSNYPAINNRDVRLLEIPCPPKVEEQAAIATILSDMDAEITALEAKLSKARQLKQGMMQELLTGRIRLV